VIDDLNRMLAKVQGKPEPSRVPVLSTFQSPNIDFTKVDRTTLTIVGWNLDIAAKDAEKYKIQIEDKDSQKRDVAQTYISYQGQYAVSVDISSSGVPLKYGDAKLAFLGYGSPSSVNIVNTDPPPTISEIRLDVGTTWDDKDKEITFTYSIERVSDGKTVGALSAGGGEEWPDPSEQKPQWRQFSIPIASANQFPASERLGYRLHVHYSSSDGDPKWNGRFKAQAVVASTRVDVLEETSDFNFGHRDDGNPDDRMFVFNK
jgi:hypothetical protein